MEWCRMYVLRIVVWTVLLGCSLSVSLPDYRRPDSSKPVSEAESKLKELLKSLEEFNMENRPTMPPVKNFSKPEGVRSSLSRSKSSDARARLSSGEVDGLPNDETIRSYQDFYSTMYGTQEGVNLLRKRYGPNGLKKARAKFTGVNKGMEDVRLANEHYLRIRSRARCRTPVPQVIRVKDYYPNPSREYLPRCTFLHRCADTTGCCDSDAFHCVPSAIQEVTLHFYTLTVDRNGMAYKADNRIEKLLFQNHTACQCQPINNLPRSMDGRPHPLDGIEDPPPSKSKCRECPVPFTSRIYKDGRCGCDCFDRQKPCIKIKRGKEPLTEIERRCVEANHCHIPDCEYGLYNQSTGHCPRRHDEEQRTHPRRPNQLPQNHRWAFLERD